MADHNAVIEESATIDSFDVREVETIEQGVEESLANAPFFFSGKKTARAFTAVKKLEFCNLPEVFYSDALFGNLILDPLLIEVGFITEQSQHEILLWNTFQEDAKTLSNIVKEGEEGTTLEDETTPQIVPATGQILFTLTVLEDGPAVQNTTYQFISSPFLPVLKITGIRIEPFLFEPDWRKIKISYSFRTVVNRNKRFLEQRRPVYSRFRREQVFSMTFTAELAQRLANDMKRFHEKVVAIPIFVEALSVDGSIQGLTTITVNENISSFFNLIESTKLVLFKDKQTFEFELKEIDSIDAGANTITFKREIQTDIAEGNRKIYPTFLGFFPEGYKTNYLTDEVVRFQAKAMENRLEDE